MRLLLIVETDLSMVKPLPSLEPVEYSMHGIYELWEGVVYAHNVEEHRNCPWFAKTSTHTSGW
jgi:hypothetical protein